MQIFLQELLSRDAITTVFQNTLLTGMTVEFPKAECKLLSIYLYIFIVERKKKKKHYNKHHNGNPFLCNICVKPPKRIFHQDVL